MFALRRSNLRAWLKRRTRRFFKIRLSILTNYNGRISYFWTYGRSWCGVFIDIILSSRLPSENSLDIFFRSLLNSSSGIVFIATLNYNFEELGGSSWSVLPWDLLPVSRISWWLMSVVFYQPLAAHPSRCRQRRERLLERENFKRVRFFLCFIVWG